MKRSLNILLCLTLLGAAVTGFTAHGTWEELESVQRKPIDTVAIVIKGVNQELSAHNITAETLKTDFARRLSTAGIRVINVGRLADHPGADVLTLRVTLNRAPYYFYLYGLNMAVRNRLALSPPGSGHTTVQTWSETRSGMLMPREAGSIKKMSLQMLDNLLRAHGKG